MAVKVGAAAEGTISGVDVWVGEAIGRVGRGVKVSDGDIDSDDLPKRRKNNLNQELPV